MDKLNKMQELSADLAAEIRDHGTMRSTITSQSASLWHACAHLPVTERKETIKADLAPLESEAARQRAEIEALTVELDALKFLIEHEVPDGA